MTRTTTEFRLTDELERELVIEAMTAANDVDLLGALKSAAAAVASGIGAVLAFIGNLNDAMNQARARSALYSGSQW